MKKNDFLDVMKFTLSLFVLAIHTGLTFRIGCVDLIWPWVRLAVPLFFVISSYIFFTKVIESETPMCILWSFCKRVGTLYIIWFCLLLPITIYIRRKVWFGNGVLENMLNFFCNLLFGNTFVASWYLSALMLSVICIYFLSLKFPSWFVVVLSIVLYAWAVMTSSYGVETSMKKVLIPYNSFPAALIYVTIGRMFADKRLVIRCSVHILAAFSILSLTMLGAECYWRKFISGNVQYDCYFSLVPAVIILFALMQRVSLNFKYARQLRSLSVVIFVVHGSVLGFVPIKFFAHARLLRSIIVLMICYAVYICISCLQKDNRFKWLKYSC